MGILCQWCVLAQALALVIDTEAPFEYPHAWQNVSGSQKRTNGSQNVKYSIPQKLIDFCMILCYIRHEKGTTDRRLARIIMFKNNR